MASNINGFSESNYYQVIKDRDDKELPDIKKKELAEISAKAGHGAEAGAAVRSITDETLKDEVSNTCLELLGNMDQSSPEAYDAVKGFLVNLIGPC